MAKSLKEKLQERRENLKRSGPGKFLTIKEGTTRYRVLPVGAEKDWAMEVTYFYMGVKDNMGIISPASVGEKCAILRAHKELADSKKSKDRELASKFKPQRKFLIPVIKYKDDRGKEVDEELGPKLLLLTNTVYNDLLDLYLDADSGDFTDAKKGYDIKVKRTGKGKMDTEYTVLRANPSKLESKYRKEVDLEKMVRAIIPSYSETKTILEQYFNLPPEEVNSEKKKGGKDKGEGKKKRNRDI